MNTRTKKTITALFNGNDNIFFIFQKFGFIFFTTNKLKIIWIVNNERLYLGKIKKNENSPIFAK